MLPQSRGHLMYLLAMIATLCILTSCGSGGLPPEGKMALDKGIARLAGAAVEYRILSAQKASGAPEEQRVGPIIPSDSGVYGCPPDYGDRETWCIVIGQGIADNAGHLYSHFLLRRIGDSWYVEALTDAEAGRFEYVGCSNWHAAH